MTVDAAAYLGSWPLRPIEAKVSDLTNTMRENRIKEALVSPLEGFFYADPTPANDRLLRRLAKRKKLWAAPIINLRMADWRQRIEELAGRRQVRAVRLAPSFHGYEVAEAREAVHAAAEWGLATVVQLRLQDERSHPPILKLPAVPLAEVVALAVAEPGARVIASAARLAEAQAQAEYIRQLGNLWLDISHFDGLASVKQACEAVGAERLLFSTNYPFFYARSAALKIQEEELARGQAQAVMAGNARTAFGIS